MYPERTQLPHAFLLHGDLQPPAATAATQRVAAVAACKNHYKPLSTTPPYQPGNLTATPKDIRGVLKTARASRRPDGSRSGALAT